MKKNAISEFELEREDFKIKLKRGTSPVTSPGSTEENQTAYLPATAATPTAVASPVGAPVPVSGAGAVSELEIKSPMVGTFYRAPSPESPNYVEVGAEVNPDTVVCIIEAMKVMN